MCFNWLMFCRPRQNPCGKAEDDLTQITADPLHMSTVSPQTGTGMRVGV